MSLFKLGTVDLTYVKVKINISSTSLSGWLNKNCVAKVYVLSFFFARSSLSVPAKISTLGF